MRNFFFNQPLLALAAVVLLAFGIHAVVLDAFLGLPAMPHLLPTYLFNGLAALVVLRVLLHFLKKKNPNLGFFFMGGSLLKLTAFLILFYPSYKSDGELSTLEFTSFFVPYFICLVFKSLVLFRTLNTE